MKEFLYSKTTRAFGIGFVAGIVFLMIIRGLHFVVHGTVYPLGY